MPIFTIYCLTLLALVAGLLTTTGMQAQRSLGTASTAASGDNFNLAATAGELLLAPLASASTNLGTPPPPEASASFYDDSHQDLGQSLAGLQASNAAAPTYWNLYTESRIRLKMSDYLGARLAAEQAYKLAVGAMPTSKEYVLLSASMVAQAHLLAQR
jgi:hypothetical protein